MAGSYYNRRRAVGQMKAITTSVHSGINEFGSTNRIGDNLLSGAVDARPNATNDGILLGAVGDNPKYAAYMTGAGKVQDAIVDKGATEHLFLVAVDWATGHNGVIDDLIDLNITAGTKTVNDISSYGLAYTDDGNGGWNGNTSMCVFLTEAKRYICLAISEVKKLLVYDYTTFQAVTLPFYPKKLITHVNRIFAVDTLNKLWWCRAGDLFTWYGLEEDADRLVTNTHMLDSGTYTIAAQPDVVRPLSITVIKDGTIDTLGTLTFVGTDVLDRAMTKTYTPVDGKYVTPDAWKTVTSITAAGHTAVGNTDHITIGIAPVSTYVQEDAGYWTIESEPSLLGMAVLGGTLYLGGYESIYAFSGYSPDTFQLTKVVSGVGGLDAVVENGVAFFWHNRDLYEYNGQSYPRIINKPVLSNGSNINGIYGGIEYTQGQLSSDGTFLYVDPEQWDVKILTPTQDAHQHWHYMFDIRARTWWRKSGICIYPDENYYSYTKYIRRANSASMWTIANWIVPPAEAVWEVKMYMGNRFDYLSWFCTKAFNDGVSEDSTLTDINILCRSYYAPYDDDDDDGGANLTVYYSKSSWANPYDMSPSIVNDWTVLKAFTPSEIPEELGVLHIPLAGSEINRTKCYMLKFEWASDKDLEIFGIERRYRAIGRSR